MKSNTKGSNYERGIAKKLSIWWTDGQDPNVFYRTGGSGSRSKLNENAVKNQYGDVMAVNPVGYPLTSLCTIELKHGYSKNGTKWDLMTLVDSNNKNVQFVDFMRQSYEDSRLCHHATGIKLYPLVIARRDRRSDVIFVPHDFKTALNEWIGSDVLNEVPHLTINFGMAEEILTKTHVYGLDEFLECVPPKVIIAMNVENMKNAL
jgi:hypothetical protein